MSVKTVESEVAEENRVAAPEAAAASGAATGEAKATNVTWHEHQLNKRERARRKGQRPCIVWLTGLSGSGKSTIANALEVRLAEMGYHTYLLDGDNIRHGLNKDLGFSAEDRRENIRRIGEAAKLFVDAGIIAITAFISPYRSDRDMVREIVEDDEFLEVFVDTPLAVCEQRDPKGLYKKARRGEIKNFTGLDSPYEQPAAPEVHLKPGSESVEQSVDRIIRGLEERGVLPAA